MKQMAQELEMYHNQASARSFGVQDFEGLEIRQALRCSSFLPASSGVEGLLFPKP